MRSLNFRIFNDLSAIESQWSTLQSNGVTYLFQSFEWCSTWYDIIGQRAGAIPYVVTIAKDDLVGAIIPLVVLQEGGLHRLRFMAYDVSDYQGPLLSRELAVHLGMHSASKLWDQILALLPKVDLVELKRMPESIDGIANPFIDFTKAIRDENGHSAKLPKTFEAFAANRKKRLFNDSGRQRRRIAEIGSTEVIIADDKSVISQIINAMILQKGRRYIDSIGVNKFETRPELVEFYSRISALRSPNLRGHVSALCVSRDIIATHIGAVFRNRFYYIIPSYASENWMRYSPGRILMEELIRNCIEAGLETFDLTVGDDAYKKDWADTTLPLYRDVRAITWRGRVVLFFVLLKQNFRGALKRVGWLRSLVKKYRDTRSSKKLKGLNDVVHLHTEGPQ